jgi:hypothetical protein
MKSNNVSQGSSAPTVLTEPTTRLWSVLWQESIKRRIVERTGGRIQSLRVETVGGRVVINGSAASFYLKQLALRGVRDVVGSAAMNEIDFNLQVSDSP